MRRLVSTLSSEVALLLEQSLMQRADLHLVAARSIDELVTLTREGAELCLVEPLLPDGDAYDALDAVRASAGGARTPVVLVVTADAPAPDAEGFAGVLVLPAPDEVVETLLSRLLGEQRRRAARRPASAWVRDERGAPLGRLVDLSRGGVALRTRRPLSVGAEVTLSLELPLQPAPLRAVARVVRTAGEHVALAIAAPEAALVEALEILLAPPRGDDGLAFRPLPALGERTASIGGALVDGPARAALQWFMTVPVSGPARLVVSDLSPFDERALDRWVALVGAIAPIELLGCPTWLRALADRVPAALGSTAARARLSSIQVALRCDGCHDEHEHETVLPVGDRAAQLAAIEAVALAGCFVCGGALRLVEPTVAMLPE